MSVAASIPCISRLPKTASAASTASSCCTSSSTAFPFRLLQLSSSCTTTMSIRSSQTEGPIRRPVAPSPAPSLQPPSPPPPKPAAVVEDNTVGVVMTLEFQRAKARELQEYFKQKKLDQASQGPVFGWVPKNEIGNGRWAMFGFAVGMLTEYATGSDFVDQLKLILSNLGIVDID